MTLFIDSVSRSQSHIEYLNEGIFK